MLLKARSCREGACDLRVKLGQMFGSCLLSSPICSLSSCFDLCSFRSVETIGGPEVSHASNLVSSQIAKLLVLKSKLLGVCIV